MMVLSFDLFVIQVFRYFIYYFQIILTFTVNIDSFIDFLHNSI